MDVRVTGQMQVVYWFGTSFIVPISAYTRIYPILGGKSREQSDEWVVNYKSWVVNYTWHNIQTDIILELKNFKIQNIKVKVNI